MGKIADFGHKLIKGFGKGAAHMHLPNFFLEYSPPPPGKKSEMMVGRQLHARVHKLEYHHSIMKMLTAVPDPIERSDKRKFINAERG